jgi:predicted acylesterase/phospholipase RssA
VLAMKDHYRFVQIGGSSAGAVAAALSAAAEYARDNDATEDGFTRLNDVRLALQEPGLLKQLFQPTRQARPVMDLLLASQGGRTLPSRAARGIWQLFRRLWLPVALEASAIFCLVALAIGDAGGTWRALRPAGWAALGAILLVTVVSGFALTTTVWAARLVTTHIPASYFGLCMGKAKPGSGCPALTEWLHEQIKYISGELENPLTFADLAAKGVTLRVMTTDLARARPVRMPYDGDDYWFAPTELAALFPDEVIDYLQRECPESRPAGGNVPELRRLPDSRLPIIVAVRMSLAFPGLLAAVPLWTIVDGRPVRHWFSDGGISSNFPMHLFDAWVPIRPSFGLNIVPASMVEKEPETAKQAVQRRPDEPPPLRRARIRRTIDFVGQIIDTMQNWRDAMQGELPQFRDRITDIELSPGEGGKNLVMPPEVIKRIDRKGRHAGETFTQFDWPSHQLRRYAWAMRTLQRNLRHAPPGRPTGLSDAFTADFQQWLSQRTPGVKRPLDRPPQWYEPAATATRKLLRDADAWFEHAKDLSFDVGAESQPASVMRITPDI